jgi:hypothetical protein
MLWCDCVRSISRASSFQVDDGAETKVDLVLPAEIMELIAEYAFPRQLPLDRVYTHASVESTV